MSRNTNVLIRYPIQSIDANGQTIESTGIIELIGVAMNEISLGAQVSSQTISKASPITDHVFPNNPSFALDVTFGDILNAAGDGLIKNRVQQFLELEQLVKESKIFRIETDFGAYDSMAIISFKVKQSSGSMNAFTASIDIAQLTIAELELWDVQIILDADGTPVSVSAVGGTTTESPLSQPVQTHPEESNNWWDALWRWLTGGYHGSGPIGGYS